MFNLSLFKYIKFVFLNIKLLNTQFPLRRPTKSVNFILIIFTLTSVSYTSILYSKPKQNLNFTSPSKIVKLDNDMLYYKSLLINSKKLISQCSLAKTNNRKYSFSIQKNEKFKRIVLTSLQYLLMTESMKMIAKYSVGLNQELNDFKNEILKLRNNYCSVNISFISRKFIIKKWLDIFSILENDKSLVHDFNFSKYYSKKYLRTDKLTNFKKYKSIAVEIFKRSCSWDSNVYKVGALNTFLMDPTINIILAHKMMGQVFKKNSPRNGSYVDSSNGIFLNCKNIICRQNKKSRFFEKLKVVEKNDLISHVNSYVCLQRSKKSNLHNNGIEELLMNSLLISKITNVPDLFLTLKDSTEITDNFALNLHKHMDDWSLKALKVNVDNMPYEESLTYKIVKPKVPSQENFIHVNIDVDHGEIDKINQINGKLSINKSIYINQKLLNWIKKESFKKNVENPLKEKELLIRRLSIKVQDSFKSVYKNLKSPPKIELMSKLIASDIYQQLLQNNLKMKFSSIKSNIVEIPVNFHYGLFAIRYIGQLEDN